MSGTETCRRCGGELQEGELVVRATSSGPSRTDPFITAMMMRTTDIVSSMGMTQEGNISVEGPFWQEYTGKETGWLSKKKELKTFSVKGKRCTKCGYIELYVQETQK